jgi:hypothetical protein
MITPTSKTHIPTNEEALDFQRTWYDIFDKMDEYFEVVPSAEAMWDFTQKLAQKDAMLLYKQLLHCYGVEAANIPKKYREPGLRAAINAIVTVLLFRTKHDDEQYRAMVEAERAIEQQWAAPPTSEAVH